MSAPTCWYCPVQYCGYVASQSGRCPNHEDKLIEHWLLGPGCNLPTLLRGAGYDVRDVAAAKDGVWLETDPETAAGLVVVLPDEKEAT